MSNTGYSVNISALFRDKPSHVFGSIRLYLTADRMFVFGSIVSHKQNNYYFILNGQLEVVTSQ